MTNAPPIGCTPNQRDKYSTDDCVADVNELAKLYNSRLKKLLPKLTTILARSTFVYMDSYAALDDILQNYKSYGDSHFPFDIGNLEIEIALNLHFSAL